MKLMVIPVGRSLVFGLQLSQILRLPRRWPKKGVRPVTGMGVAGSVIRIEGGFPENSDNIPGRPADDNASVAAHSTK
jgi:hypothetical protein